MAQYALPAIFALFVWWFSTGVALTIVGLPRSTVRWSMLGAAVLFAGALYGIAKASTETSTLGTYGAFTFAILLWGAIEISFLTGVVTGPRREACPVDCAPWTRTRHAVAAILYHELLLLGSGLVVAAVTWGEVNQVGVWTFVLLWIMRLSAKLNLFLGVPVLNDQFLPEPVAHLKSYFHKGPVNLLFPIVVTLSIVAATLLAQRGAAAFATDAEVIGFTLLAALMVLAVLEHWFMVLPLSIETLWGWGMASRADAATAPSVAVPPVSTRIVSIARAVEGARVQSAFEAWTAPVIDARSANPPEQSEASCTRTNILPHPALTTHRRRP